MSMEGLELRLFFTIEPMPLKDAKRQFQKRFIKDLLIMSLGNVSLAAKRASIDRKHLYRLMNDLDLDPEAPRKDLVKPYEYVKEGIQNLVEEDVDGISAIICQHLSNISYDDAFRIFEKELIIKVLKEREYDLPKSASFLRISQKTLQRKIQKYSIAGQ
jgi:DNA-binding NtrC family response regulator